MKFLIAGLGNPGTEYDNTRHNIGFEALDFIAQKYDVVFKDDRFASVAEFKLKGKHFILIKPSTYMNLSGRAILFWINKLQIEPQQLLVITDDLNLPLGKLRIKPKGTHGGHNGLKSIQEMMDTVDFPRLRFGIGDTFAKGKQVNFVLGKWNKPEQLIVQEKVSIVADLIISFGLEGIEKAMNLYN